MAEAGAVLVLEELEHARARGATIYAEFAGYGTSSDANHVSDPDPVGHNPARALRMAFKDAGVDPAEVGYVNAHGTSTPAGDAAETRALKLAFGEETAARLPISSTKGATGHTLGAAGAVEAIFTILALQTGVLPPTINYATARPGVRPRLHPERGAPEQPVDVALSNSFGFGGHNTAVLFRRLSVATTRACAVRGAAPRRTRRGPCAVEARVRPGGDPDPLRDDAPDRDVLGAPPLDRLLQVVRPEPRGRDDDAARGPRAGIELERRDHPRELDAARPASG